MATYTDDFNRANENPLSSPWSTIMGSGLQLLSNSCKAAASGKNVSALTGETWDNDQTATVEVTNIQSYDFAGAAVRCSGSNGYVGIAAFGDGRFYCYRVDSGVWTSLGFRSVSFVATDTIGIGIVGSTITLYKNDVAQGSTFTDSTYTSGAAGMCYDFQDSNLTTIDNFSATGWDSLSISATTDPVVDQVSNSITTSGLTGTPTGTLGGATIALSGTLPNLNYTTDIAGIASETTGPLMGENVELAVTGNEGTATTNVTTQAKSGWAVVTLSSPTSVEGNIKKAIEDNSAKTVVTGNRIYYDTVSGTTTIASDGTITSDGDFQIQLSQGGSATVATTYTPFYVSFGSGNTPRTKFRRFPWQAYNPL